MWSAALPTQGAEIRMALSSREHSCCGQRRTWNVECRATASDPPDRATGAATWAVLERLAALERPPGSEGERRAAELIAAELGARGARVRIEAERVHGT